ncbi:MAG: hypothetical protein HYV90_01345 [Candidatus Woesebacteria bacterium]|nr:MAG: hypothetical protein HYV90_01345 [Candidatus Woesebacteria bacterium]
MKERETAFPEANYSVLAQIALEMEIEIPEDRDVNFAQELFNRGIKMQGLDLEPRESYMLQVIMKHATPENFPPKLVVYLNDRINAGIEEADVPTVYARQSQVARNNLMSAVKNAIPR